jgi:hypothetical protein
MKILLKHDICIAKNVKVIMITMNNYCVINNKVVYNSFFEKVRNINGYIAIYILF